MIKELADSGFVQVFDLLSPSELLALNGFIDGHKAEFVRAKIGKDDTHKELAEIRGDSTFWIDPLNPPVEFRRLITFLETLKTDVNREFFLGLKEFECHLAVYPPGTYYKKHSDRFATDSSRSLSFVFYLHQNWSPGDGGELVLFNKQNEVVQEIRPVPGSLACFLSDDFPHEVKTSFIERRSFTGWMHTKRLY